MNKIVDLIIFIVVIAVLWWALNTVLTVLGVTEPFHTLAVVAFIVIAVLAAVDYVRGGGWFWHR